MRASVLVVDSGAGQTLDGHMHVWLPYHGSFFRPKESSASLEQLGFKTQQEKDSLKLPWSD